MEFLVSEGKFFRSICLEVLCLQGLRGCGPLWIAAPFTLGV